MPFSARKRTVWGSTASAVIPALPNVNLFAPNRFPTASARRLKQPLVCVDEQHPKALAGHVPQVLSGSEVQGLLADVGCLIRDPLETPHNRHQGGQSLEWQQALLSPLHQIRADSVPHFVDPRLDGHGRAGEIGIPIHEGANGVVQHGDGHVHDLIESLARHLVKVTELISSTWRATLSA